MEENNQKPLKGKNLIVRFAKGAKSIIDSKGLSEEVHTVNKKQLFLTVVNAVSKGLKSEDLGKEYFLANSFSESEELDWEDAHELYRQMRSNNETPEYIEPNLDEAAEPSVVANVGRLDENEYMSHWPAPPVSWTLEKQFSWHMQDEFTQLLRARRDAANNYDAANPVRIAHLDTGFTSSFSGIPTHLRKDLSRNFISGEDFFNAEDKKNKRGAKAAVDGHGGNTLSVLAGNCPYAEDGEYGGAPEAEIICCRISDSVVLLKTENFPSAIYYAVAQGCHVISMSMAGLPSLAWRDAVNYAYEQGVVIVTAGSNSWVRGPKKFLPNSILWPARFHRVIGVTGVAANQEPYYFKANSYNKDFDFPNDETPMQGSFIPPRFWATNMAAYSPNISFAQDGPFKFRRTGGGTSASTPQVAAAAALWIQKNRTLYDSLTPKWKRAEIVRQALFQTTKQLNIRKGKRKYSGRGVLQAADALNHIPNVSSLSKAKSSKIFLPLMQAIFAKNISVPLDNNQEDMITTELGQLAVREPELTFILDENDAKNVQDAQLKRLKERVLASDKASRTLKEVLQD